MSEKTAYTAFRRNVMMPGDRIDRIENLVGLGFPDTNCCFSGVEFWMEIKAPHEPKRPTTPLFGSNHKLSIDQRNWFLKQYRASGRGYIYVDTDHRRILLSGKDADHINAWSVPQMINKSLWWAHKPTFKEQWRDLRTTLIHGQI